MVGHSGRWPWGSGKDPYQSSPVDFLSRIDELKSKGWKPTKDNIEKEFNMTSTEYRQLVSIAADTHRMQQIKRAKSLIYDKDTNPKGHSLAEVARRMNVNESTIRGWLKEDENSKVYQTKNIVDVLKKEVANKRMIDVGEQVAERELNISREKLDTALYVMEKEGYHVYKARVPQPTNPTQYTTMKVLTVPEIVNKEHPDRTPAEVYDFDKIGTIKDYISRDGGMTLEKKFTYPTSMDSKRLMVRYADDVGPDGVKGIEKDGTIEIRRNVPDLNLGESRYAQVRILVDGTHYMKGMAHYSDNMPDGIDVVFNTNKKPDVPLKGGKDRSVLKPIKSDPDNPFGSLIKDADLGGQYWYIDPKDGKRKLGLINKRADEGDWSEWKNGVPSQFLSKQSKELAKQQLNLKKAEKEQEYAEILSLENPTIKKYYLDKFAKQCDKDAVELKAASFHGQRYHVILPIESVGDTQVYAPNYKDGTKLALIRYPHGGRFEIPILTVNNNNKVARSIISPQSTDAIGVSSKVAQRLSGADFDGDTVMCIPTHDRQGRVHILSRDELPGLKDFDSKSYIWDEKRVNSKGETEYYRQGHKFKPMTNTDTQMGVISNLITDMTLLGAGWDEIERAVKHSMVVIDAEKHKLDYRQSEIDNDIPSLRRKWQRTINPDGTEKIGGASTLISRAKSPAEVPKRRGEPKTNVKGTDWYDPNKPEGSLIYNIAYDNNRYYADSKFNKKTGMQTIVLKDGKKVTYDVTNPKERAKYHPVMKTDPKTGEIYFTNKDGTLEYRRRERTDTITKMEATTDARTLYSKPDKPHPMEEIYADYANYMKGLANRSRLESYSTPSLKYNPEAKKKYAKEVSELDVSLNNALKNKIPERIATRYAASEQKRKKNADPDLKPEDIRKIGQQAMTKYREMFNAVPSRKREIKITDKQWEAIQAGAISNEKLKKILDNSDPDILRELAMPKNRKEITPAMKARIIAMKNANLTNVQIAETMHLSPKTISNILKGV